LVSPLTLSLSPAGRGEGEGARCQKTKRLCIRTHWFLRLWNPGHPHWSRAHGFSDKAAVSATGFIDFFGYISAGMAGVLPVFSRIGSDGSLLCSGSSQPSFPLRSVVPSGSTNHPGAVGSSWRWPLGGLVWSNVTGLYKDWLKFRIGG